MITASWHWKFAHTLYLIPQNTFFFNQSSKKPVPVFTHKPFHTQHTLSRTLLVSNSRMNHKQLTSSLGLNERHASVGNRMKARFVPFLFLTKHMESSVCLRWGDNSTICLCIIGCVAVPFSIHFDRLFVCTACCWIICLTLPTAGFKTIYLFISTVKFLKL